MTDVVSKWEIQAMRVLLSLLKEANAVTIGFQRHLCNL